MGTEAPRQKIEMFEIRFTQQQLMRMSPQLRELFVRLGLSMNDLLFLQRIYLACGNTEPVSEAARAATTSHQTSAFLLLVGKLFEAGNIFDQWFLSTTLGRDLTPKMDAAALASVEALKKLRGTSSALAKVRNSFAFHYHDEPLNPHIEAIPASAPLTYFLSNPEANTLRHFALEPLLRSLVGTLGSADPETAMQKFVDLVNETIRHFSTFATVIDTFALEEMFGASPPLTKSAIDSRDFRERTEVDFPPLVSVAETST
jgi:hypothetical protein